MQNLIRLREPWEQNLAQEDPTIPKQAPQRRILLDREINRLIPLVVEHLGTAEVNTEVIVQELDQRLDNERIIQRHVDRPYDLFESYFELEGRSDTFIFQMQALERGIGVYSARRERAFREMFSPITWLAWAVSLPILVLERAGVPMEDASSSGVQAVAWLLRLGMFVLIALVGTKLGVSIPWDKIGSLLK
jgi:hypothetical protein